MSSSSGASPSQGWFLAPKKLLATQAVVFIVLVGTLVSGSYLGQRTLSEKGWSLGRWHLSGHKNSTWESEPSLEHLSGSPFEVSPEKEQGTARGLEPEADQGLEPHAVQGPKPPVGVTCEQWLLEADGPVVPGGRNFSDEPVMIFEAELPSYLAASKEELRGCDVACRPILPNSEEAQNVTRWDAITYQLPHGPPDRSHGFRVLRNMESAGYYPYLAVSEARKQGYDIVMTSDLTSDVPLLYIGGGYSRPGLLFEEKIPAVASAISNCGGFSSRLEIIAKLREYGVDVHQYGGCNRTHEFPDEPPPLGMNEADALAYRYLFYYAAENSIYPDYVSEKFFRGLQVGTVPIYLGSPTGPNFAPAENAVLWLRGLEDVPRVAEEIKRLTNDRAAYEERLAWKTRGASNAFRALLSNNAFARTCMLCVHIATRLQEEELAVTGLPESGNGTVDPTAQVGSSTGLVDHDATRPCSCVESLGSEVGKEGGERTVFHLYVRELNAFRYLNVFIRSNDLSMAALEKAITERFQGADYTPLFPGYGFHDSRDGYRVFKVYPVLTNQRRVLFEDGAFATDNDFRKHLESVLCPQLEVIFV